MIYTTYLYHHGILGQRWGRRNGPPYPLDQEDHSAAERKAGYRKSLGGGRNPESYRKNIDKSNGYDQTKKKGLSDRQKRALKIGAAAVVAGLAVYGGYKLYESGKLDGLIENGRASCNSTLSKVSLNVDDLKDFAGSGEFDTSAIFKDLPGKKESLEETLKYTNPLRNDVEGKNNCVYCGIAGHLRRYLGKDVEALSTGGMRQDLISTVEDCFKNVKTVDTNAKIFGKSPQDADGFLIRRFGNNASGIISVPLVEKFGGGGHAFNFEIKDGIVHYSDFQKGMSDEFIRRVYWQMIDTSVDKNLSIARLDQSEPDWDGILRIVKNRKRE